jgi:lipopolysaccharide/colanic/teichoic acid biosynthesis glycosyltransferase
MATVAPSDLDRSISAHFGSNPRRSSSWLSSAANRCTAAIGLLLTSPVLAIAALAILLEDRRPIFFSQWRVGQFGKPFRILKLRTMLHSGQGGHAVTQGGDPRITSVGRFLRKYKIDELPQLVNVLRGEMVFVGPRPEVPRFVNLSEESWREVLRSKPGITNEVTLLLRNEEQILAGQTNPDEYYQNHLLPLKLSLHRHQLSTQSLFLHLRVLLFTVYYAAFPSRFDPKDVRRRLYNSGAPLPDDARLF